MKDIALMIKTFERSDLLFETIDHIKSNIKNVTYRIYIADDSRIDRKKRKLYDNLISEGHFVLELPYNIGASAGRNAIIPYIEEDYILRMDDDFFITEETKLLKMLNVLKNIEYLGAISDYERQLYSGKGTFEGNIRKNGQAHLKKIGKLLITEYIDDPKFEKKEGVRYYKCSFTRNFLLIKKKMLKDISWDNELQFDGEHLDFMLSIKNHPYWELAFTPDSIHTHAGPSSENLGITYKKERFNVTRQLTKIKTYQQKWDVYFFVSFNSKDNYLYKALRIVKAYTKGYFKLFMAKNL